MGSAGLAPAAVPDPLALALLTARGHDPGPLIPKAPLAEAAGGILIALTPRAARDGEMGDTGGLSDGQSAFIQFMSQLITRPLRKEDNAMPLLTETIKVDGEVVGEIQRRVYFVQDHVTLTVLNGPPGAGKTHILRELSKIAALAGTSVCRTPRSSTATCR